MNIIDRGKKSVYTSRWDAQQDSKEQWLQRRLDAMNYYRGRTRAYVIEFFSDSTLAKVPVSNINLTRRIIDRVSLVYQVAPKRITSNENYTEMIHKKDEKLQRFERIINLLELALIKPCWRNSRIEYDIITDFEPQFGDDPLEPISFTYPLAKRSEVTSLDPELWAYWSDTEHFIYDKADNEKKVPNDWDDINPYGIMPLIPIFRDGRPESEFMDTDASSDLIVSNLAINVASTTAMANVMFQSFGYMWVSGEVDNRYLEVAPDKITKLQLDSRMGVVNPPDTIKSVDALIRSNYKLLAQNYHLSTSFVDGSEHASSGVSLKVRNLELMESRKSDIEKYRNLEIKLFEIEKLIVSAHTRNDIGVLELVDFSESVEVLSDEEQRARDDWDLSHGLIDTADILIRRNPDWTREDAEEYMAKRKNTISTIKEKTDKPESIFKLGA